MKQQRLNLMTPEEAQRRIFSYTMKEYVSNNLDYAGEKKCHRLIREVVDSGLDLAHIDEYPNPPTRAPYQWFMDLVLWANLRSKGETEDGYPTSHSCVKTIDFDKIGQLSQVVVFDRRFTPDGNERWPFPERDNIIRPNLTTVGATLEAALLSPAILDGLCHRDGANAIIQILDRYLDPSRTPQEAITQHLGELLTHRGYQGNGQEPFQAHYSLVDLLRTIKKHYPAIRADEIKPILPYCPPREFAVWDDPNFAKAKQVLDDARTADARMGGRRSGNRGI